MSPSHPRDAGAWAGTEPGGWASPDVTRPPYQSAVTLAGRGRGSPAWRVPRLPVGEKPQPEKAICRLAHPVLNTVRMSLRHRLSSALAMLAGLLAASAASAQTLVLPTGARAADWPSGYAHELDDDSRINQRDCIENPSIRFNVDYTGSDLPGFGVEAWIGSTCDKIESRQGNPATCTRVAQRDLGNTAMTISVQTLVGPLDGTSTESTGGTGGTGGSAGTGGSGGNAGSIAASQLPGVAGQVNAGGGGAGGVDTSAGTSGMGGVVGASGTGGSGAADSGGTGGGSGTGGTDGTGGTGGTGGTTAGGTGGSAGSTNTIPEVCEGDETKPTPSTRTLWFMVLNEDLQAPANAGTSWVQKWTYTYDLVGPKAPTGVSAGIGENALVVKWSEAEDADSDIDEYWFLCEPPPGGDTGAAGAGGGADDGGPDDPLDSEDCESTVFQEGDVLTRATIAEHACGHAPATASSGETSALTNFVHYTVAVVGRDDYRNYGKLSAIACATPEPVTDFFEAYRDAGGKAGGGFCSIGTTRSHALTALVLAGALGFFVRRARRRSERKDASR
jgi:hypothetical protein